MEMPATVVRPGMAPKTIPNTTPKIIKPTASGWVNRLIKLENSIVPPSISENAPRQNQTEQIIKNRIHKKRNGKRKKNRKDSGFRIFMRKQ